MLLGEEPDEVYWEEAVRLAECKVDEQLVEEVSELDDAKAKYEAVMAEFADFRRATAEEKAHAVEAVEVATERKVVKKDEDELASMMAMMGRS